MKIDRIKRLPGVLPDRLIVKEIVDEKIIDLSYALRILDYIIDSQGRAWWVASGSMAAIEILSRFDTVEFYAGGVRYEGFLPEHPVATGNFSQGAAYIAWDVTILFLKDEPFIPHEEEGLGHGESPHGELGHGT